MSADQEPETKAKEAKARPDIGEAATLPASLESAGMLGVPGPKLDGLVDEAERARVLEALFGGASQSFQLGRYVIMGTLGRGGMGVVFKAFDPALDRRVALKVLHKELDEQHTTRLLREAQALAKLSHPNVVQVYEVGEIEGQTFVAMELVKGQTLREWMKKEPRPDWRACVEVLVQLGTGLAAAHARGLVHRDFKPGNAILDEEGRARVLDFGLARQATEDFDDESSIVRARTDQHEAVPLDVSLTNTGAVLGTPAYMPPEQMMGREADARSDQFSLCVALYEALYGERPFEGSSMPALMMSMTHGGIRPAPKGSTVPARLRAVVQRGLAPEPEQRWPTMDALLAELRGLVAPRQRRGLVLGLTVGLLAVGAGLGVPSYAEWKDRCTGAAAQLDGIWDDARRQEVEAAIMGTELSYALDTWERVQPRLDAYSEAWTGKHTEVCEATSVRGEQSAEALNLRMGCLGRERTALRAAVDVLATADAKTVENAVKLVAGLPGLDRCDDVPWLEEQNQRVPPPEDPEVAQQVDALREQLAVIEAMQKAGQYGPALTQAEEVLEQAEALAYEPLSAEAEYWRGELLNRNGQYTEAEQALEQAHARALRHGHDAVVLDAAQSLTFVVGYRLSRHAEGRVWANTAVPLAEHAGEDTELASSLGNLGTVFSSQGEYEQATQHFQRALQIGKKALGAEHPGVADSLNNLGGVFYHQGEYEQAKLHLQRALLTNTKILGADHPHVALSLNNLGSVFNSQGEYEQAKLHHQRALQIREKALGADHPHVADSLNNLGNVFIRQGKYEQATLYYQRALHIWEKALDADHPQVALSLNSLGVVFQMQGEYEQAKLHHQRALQIKEKALGAEHPDVAYSLGNLGMVLERQGEYEQARLHYERALGIREKALGAEHPDVADSLNNLGSVFESQGEYEQAKLHYEQALRIREKALGAEHPDVAYSLVGLATVALEQNDFDVVRTHAERAVSIREAGGVAPEDLAEARFVLARALWSDRAERSRARTLAEQARDAFAEHGQGQADNLAEAEAWLATHRVP